MINITVAQVTQMIPKEMKQDMLLKHSVQDIDHCKHLLRMATQDLVKKKGWHRTDAHPTTAKN
jgi:hypothetical protein